MHKIWLATSTVRNYAEINPSKPSFHFPVSPNCGAPQLPQYPKITLLIDVQCLVFSVKGGVYSEQFGVYSVQYGVYSAQCTLYTVHCTLYTVQCGENSGQCVVVLIT